MHHKAVPLKKKSNNNGGHGHTYILGDVQANSAASEKSRGTIFGSICPSPSKRAFRRLRSVRLIAPTSAGLRNNTGRTTKAVVLFEIRLLAYRAVVIDDYAIYNWSKSPWRVFRKCGKYVEHLCHEGNAFGNFMVLRVDRDNHLSDIKPEAAKNCANRLTAY